METAGFIILGITDRSQIDLGDLQVVDDIYMSSHIYMEIYIYIYMDTYIYG